MQAQRNGGIAATEDAWAATIEATRTARNAAVAIGGKAQHLAAEAGRQTAAAARTAYGTSNHALKAVDGLARQNVWPALLIAGALGYGLACLVKNSK